MWRLSELSEAIWSLPITCQYNSVLLCTPICAKKKLRGSIFDCVNNFVNIFCTIIVLFFIIIFIIDAIINFLSCFSSHRYYKINLISTKMSCGDVLHTRHICKTKEINLILFNLNSVEWGHILQGEFWWCLDLLSPLIIIEGTIVDVVVMSVTWICRF